MMNGRRSMHLVGGFTQGEPLDLCMTEPVEVPDDMVEEGDVLYRVLGQGIGPMNIRADDILVVQLRPNGDALTAEMVLVVYEGRAYVGRWWTKRGRRAVLDEQYSPIVEGKGIRVVGTITTIARLGI